MKSRTIIATPPGATIKEQLENRGMTQKEFAVRMDMSEKHISQLINGDVQLTPNVALRLEAVLGIPASFWENLENIYQEKLARAREENAMDADKEIIKQMPYSEMVRLGWIEATKNIEDRVRNLRKFFEVAFLGVIDNLMIPGIAYRKVSSNSSKNYHLAVWAQKAKLEARNISVSRINLQKLSSSVSKIRAFTLDDPVFFCPKLFQIMSDCGIALVFLQHIDGSFLHGASFYDGEKIVMALTVRTHDADRFWFSLFHEIGHILGGHISKSHILTDEDEIYANNFAKNSLIPPQEYSEFISAKSFSSISVRTFADKMGIDPGIVVGRLQKENHINWKQLNNLKKRYDIS